jgi:hypothetical protein
MDHSRFAICIIFPGATAYDVVNAAIKHNVHILDREPYDPEKNYSTKRYATAANGASIVSLFLFPEEKSILAENDNDLELAIKKIRNLQN